MLWELREQRIQLLKFLPLTRNQVLEILVVLRRNHIASSVWVSESVQKRLKATRQKLDKGVFCFVLSASTEYRMLQDVGNTSGILGC